MYNLFYLTAHVKQANGIAHVKHVMLHVLQQAILIIRHLTASDTISWDHVLTI